ncbi:MAG: hypothetical protein ACRDJV_14160 [Actinomycetota bacterium]
MARKEKPKDRGRLKVPEPDQMPINEIQAARLAAVSGLEVEAIVGKTVADLRKEFEFRLDPSLLFFRKICGKVVKKDPVTGINYPVPFATVHIEDTDCSFFGFFPAEWPWGWFFPFLCHREVVGTTTTDACGNFCVWVPRWEIDWILKWRFEYFCPDIFIKPSIRDLLERFRPRPFPEPDPPPFIKPRRPDPPPLLRDAGMTLRLAEHMIGREAAERLAALEAPDLLGPSSPSAKESLDHPAFPESIPPPLPFKGREFKEQGPKAIAEQLEISAELARRLDFDRFIGPFPRCHHIAIPEWVPILDIPDITFRVTQDVDGDGDEEDIYTEGFFDIRWDAGTIPPVTLFASSIARTGQVCGVPPNLEPCDEPGIYMLGTMPLINPSGAGTYPFIDTTSGYSVRPNRPHPSGRADEVPAAASAASSPVAGALEFWGCNHETPADQPADYYRVLYRTSTDGGSTWTSQAPIFDAWWQYRFLGSPPVLDWKHLTADALGWYEVIDDSEGWIPGSRLLLWWHSAPNGLHELTLELGDGSKSVIHTAPAIRLRVDHSAPQGQFTKLEYKRASDPSWQSVSLVCPTIHRNGENLQIRVSFAAWSTHLRSIAIGAGGCGGGNPTLTTGLEPFETGAAAATPTYWHKHAGDNSLSNASSPAVWSVNPGTHPPGAYNVGLSVWSRAYYTNDGHPYDPSNPDVTYNPAPIWRHLNLPIAIVD